MKYSCTIVNIEDEEVTVKINGIELTGFVSQGVNKKVGDKVVVEIELYDDIMFQKEKVEEKKLCRIGLSYTYYIYGILDIDQCKIQSVIDFTIEPYEIFDYGYLHNQFIKARVQRFNFNFV